MSQQPADGPSGAAGIEDDDTTLAAGIPGPSGTGETTDAGADPDASAGPQPQGPAGGTGA